mmetsp:Transcript_4818/g.11461  ORF Transcript_4818/g.11461 Transcript_4818/m.11461 type:complete len:203 (-) Transcript_4818:127-735(-)
MIAYCDRQDLLCIALFDHKPVEVVPDLLRAVVEVSNSFQGLGHPSLLLPFYRFLFLLSFPLEVLKVCKLVSVHERDLCVAGELAVRGLLHKLLEEIGQVLIGLIWALLLTAVVIERRCPDDRVALVVRVRGRHAREVVHRRAHRVEGAWTNPAPVIPWHRIPRRSLPMGQPRAGGGAPGAASPSRVTDQNGGPATTPHAFSP